MRTFPNTPITNLCISGLKIHTLNWSLEIWHLPHTIMACIDKFWVFALALLLLASPLLQGLLPLFLDLDPFHLRSLHVAIIVISYWIYDKVPIFTLVLAQLFPFQLPPWALLFYCLLFIFIFLNSDHCWDHVFLLALHSCFDFREWKRFFIDGHFTIRHLAFHFFNDWNQLSKMCIF